MYNDSTYSTILSRYVSANFPVFPLKKGNNVPEIDLSDYFQIFSNKNELKQLFQSGGEKNVGLLTGKPLNVVAIETCDEKVAEILENIYHVNVNQAKMKTEKGRTYFFKIPDMPDGFQGFQIKRDDEVLINVKANGDYVLIPPSQVNGFTYSWFPSFNFFFPVISFEEFLKIVQQAKELLSRASFSRKNPTENDFSEVVKNLSQTSNFHDDEQKEQKEKTENFGPHLPFETEKAFYTSCFALGNQRKRYAMLKKERQIWEVVEKVKNFKKEEEYLEDARQLYETIVLKKHTDAFTRETLFSYVAIELKKHVADFIIQSGTKKRDEVTKTTCYDLTIQTPKSPRPICFEERSFEELLSEVRNECLVISSQKIKDAVSKCISDLINAGKIQIKTEITKPGFFLTSSKEITASRLNVKEVSRESLKKSLLILDNLVNHHFKKVKEKFVTVLKWFVVAPFSYVAKSRKQYLKGLYLHGASGVGKSTMSVLLSSMWGDFQSPGEKGGPSIDTIAKLGKVLGDSTFPHVISDPQGALMKEEIKEAIKNALTGTVVRSKFVQRQFVHVPALANVVFTSNHFVPTDEAFLRRFVVISFSRSEAPSLTREVRKNFERARNVAEKTLPVLGHFIAGHLNDEDLKNLVLSLNDENMFEVARNVLAIAYQKAGLKLPEWIDYLVSDDYDLENLEVDVRSAVISDLRSAVLSELKGLSSSSFEDVKESLAKCLSNQMLPFAFYKKDTVFLTSKTLSFLTTYKISNLKELAEVLNCKWETRSFRFGKNVMNVSVVAIPLKDFVEMMFPPA